ncbi:hypothetical protein OIDMADRAFT_135626 [Oidiodendron maius Zn]|uniref:AMP-dependent synthetase/ligase domain-containing protein n=1 Tax=Oidiodendron maius (strain Zn) TaxID=913774 RepID=A0A0C3GWL2_OIDMZ|nr:hypothetical protein OIDMADRAFT_135626 [Oidiodendron maius Zn]
MATPLLSVATTLAAAAYLNAKLGVSIDLQQLRYDREWHARFIQRLQSLGDTCTLYRIFELADHGAEALWFEGRAWTYRQLKKEVDRFAGFLSENGVACGDFIAVFTTNSPEMVITVLALSKLGCVPALVNTNLRDDTLKHCLDISTARLIISTYDLAGAINTDLRHISINLSSFQNIAPSNTTGVLYINLESLPHPAVITPCAKGTLKDLSVLIYTSGTTGKPKACACRNNQIIVTSNPLSQDVRDPKKYFPLRTYSPLPLFHGTALFTGLSYSIGNSSTLCLARKFSTSRFWQDVIASKATRILYVGELCRYLVSAQPSPYDRAHSCIVACGNGLRGEIWETFREKFGIPEIREFYRSTEGVAKFDNFGKGAAGAGKIGFAGVVRKYMENDTFIVRTDPETEEVYRNPKTGFCVTVRSGEPGEVIGRVRDLAVLTEYLNNPSASQKKLLTDVFAKGDCFQRMGDLLLWNSSGWVQFYDRMGDTFRWKGENVSAGEVRDHIGKLSGVQDAVVYGMKLSSYDGQAGAAAITLDSSDPENFMKGLYIALKKTGLPSYAMPRLVRITEEIESNATFKKAKQELLKRSWNENEDGNTDRLYWLNGTTYERLDRASWDSIKDGRAKL